MGYPTYAITIRRTEHRKHQSSILGEDVMLTWVSDPCLNSFSNVKIICNTMCYQKHQKVIDNSCADVSGSGNPAGLYVAQVFLQVSTQVVL